MRLTSGIVTVLALAAVPAVGAAAPARSSSTGNWQIALRGTSAYPRATGNAQYQWQAQQRELSVEVEHVRSLHGTTVVVRVDGVSLGTMLVSSRGRAHLDLNTERGQVVPALHHGSTVTVTTPAGVAVAQGAF
jgi:hypothetical protein